MATIFSNKFGDDVISLEHSAKRFKEIRNLGVCLEGVHFHCGSGQHGSSSFKNAIDVAKACMEIGRK